MYCHSDGKYFFNAKKLWYILTLYTMDPRGDSGVKSLGLWCNTQSLPICER